MHAAGADKRWVKIVCAWVSSQQPCLSTVLLVHPTLTLACSYAAAAAGTAPASRSVRPNLSAAQQVARQQGGATPSWKAAADRVAAAAAPAGPAERVAAAAAHAGPLGSTASAVGESDGTYNAVPPPHSLAPSAGAGAGRGRRAFSIRPQLPKQRPAEPAQPLVAAFSQAASNRTGSGAAAAAAPTTAAPAYTTVQVPSQQQRASAAATAVAPAPAAVAPHLWPPALKSYVERAFKACEVVRCCRAGGRAVPWLAPCLGSRSSQPCFRCSWLHPPQALLYSRVPCAQCLTLGCQRLCCAAANLHVVVNWPVSSLQCCWKCALLDMFDNTLLLASAD